MKVEITKLNDIATVQYTYNGNCTTDERINIHAQWSNVRKTVDNKTYWEEEAKRIEDLENNYTWLLDVEASVDDNLLVVSDKRRHLLYYSLNLTDEYISKRDWKTGWNIYMYLKMSNDTYTLREQETVETVEKLLGVSQGLKLFRYSYGYSLLP